MSNVSTVKLALICVFLLVAALFSTSYAHAAVRFSWQEENVTISHSSRSILCNVEK